VPTSRLSDANGAPHPDASSYAKSFSGNYEHRIAKAALGTICSGSAEAFAEAIVDVDGFLSS